MVKTGTDIQKASRLILEGKLVAIPTETVYGLAANAMNEKAVLSIFAAKQRPFFDPLILHVSEIDQVKELADLSDKRLIDLAARFWPGPLTLLLPKKNTVSDLVTSGLPQVAVRIPNHPLTLELLRSVKVPLAAPSANPFGYISPTEAQHVVSQMGDKVDYILDGGPSGVGLESTIIGLEQGKICVFRLGGLPLEEIEKVVGKTELKLNVSSDPKAPGQLKNHYSPRKPILLGPIKDLIKKHQDKKLSVITFGPVIEKFEVNAKMYNLSEKKDLSEAAINLFKFLRLADEDDSDLILGDFLPEQGLGLAINDRLKRASAK